MALLYAGITCYKIQKQRSILNSTRPNHERYGLEKYGVSAKDNCPTVCCALCLWVLITDVSHGYDCRDEAFKAYPQLHSSANSMQLETAAFNRSNTSVSVVCVSHSTYYNEA